MKYSDYFVEDIKNDGETRFIKIREGAPEALHDFVRSVHVDEFDGLWPNDWVYRTISQAFDELEENGNDIDGVNIEPDCYYSDLDKWFCDNRIFSSICDDAVAEGLVSGKEIYKTIAAGQWLAMDRIYRRVSEFLEEAKEEEEQTVGAENE